MRLQVEEATPHTCEVLRCHVGKSALLRRLVVLERGELLARNARRIDLEQILDALLS